MADYGIDININNYSGMRPVYYTNPLNQDRENVIIRMVLNAINFNFSLAKSDLGDLRVAERDNGTHVLRMWISYFDSSKPYANIYFKLPSILANQTVTLWTFFGNTSAVLVNEPTTLGFIFYETFDSQPSSSKWAGDLNNGVSAMYGYALEYGGGLYDAALYGSVGVIRTITNPLLNKTNWILEAGTYLNGDYGGGTYSGDNEYQERSHAVGFIGTNSFGIQYVSSTQKGICTSIANSSSWVFIGNATYPEPYSYQENFIVYQESLDAVIARSYDRNTFADAFSTVYRKVSGETKINNIAVMGRLYELPYWVGAGPTYISWLILREFDVAYRTLVDCSELYMSLSDRSIEHQALDYKEYGDDLTNVLYKHESSFGGDPLLLSDNSINTTWISDSNATLESEIGVTISFCNITSFTNSDYTHYDLSHVKYFGAVKLSDKDEDVWRRNFWDCTTAINGWAAIKFNEGCVINSVSITAVAEDLNCCPKNYIFFGSNFSPVTDFDKAVELCSGVFSNITTSQQFFFINIIKYKYYILFIIDNYGGSHIRIREWEMYNIPSASTKKRVSQLRLLPPTDDLLYSFPNEISLQASVDEITWDTLIPWTQTYSPFVQHYPSIYGFWQIYSFVDPTEKGYCSYKLLCRDNWGDLRVEFL